MMTTNWWCWCWKLGLVSWLAMGGAIAASGNCALAQITPDGTLGVESSVVTPLAPGSPVDAISGGATRGANLFHSFEQFSVLTGREARFNNALDIQNIISRVTGASISNIDGKLQANGTANLFLINPNGIVFGPSASLDVGGSFVASTASSVNFADGIHFSATAPQATPLLTVSVPIGLQFGGPVGGIRVQGAGLAVQPGKTLALLGGDVALLGGYVYAEGGRIDLGSVAGPGLVSLNPNQKGFSLSYEGVPTFRDIQLSQQARADASGEGGGDIQLQGRRVTLTDGSQIGANTLGSEPGGTLNVTASESMEAIGESADGQFLSGLGTQVYPGATGAGGNLTLKTGRLIVRDGAQVSTGTFGEGSSGTLAVEARESVELIGTSADGEYASGLLTSVAPGATGDGGNLTLETGRLIVRDGAQIAAGTYGAGSAGILEVSARESMELIGKSRIGKQYSSALSASVNPGATGAGGNLTLKTGRLIVQDGAQIAAGTHGEGPGGTLEVEARESVELIGRSVDSQFPSGLFTSSTLGATGDGGNLTLKTERLIVRDGATVFAGTLSEGKGGNLVVRASDLVELSGTSANGKYASTLAASTSGIGDAGDVRIETGQLTLRDRAEVTVRSEGSAIAGNLQVQARSIQLDKQAAIRATTRSGNGGDITLRSQDLLLLRRNSNISTRSGTLKTSGSGGSITIDTDNLVGLENSDIDANAFGGSGGQVRITAQGIFGTEGRESQTPESDITASSNLGPQFRGTVEINTPDVDLSSGLATLPAELVDVTGLIAQGCPGGGGTLGRGVSKFIITGRGGLPPNPTEALRSDAVRVDLDTPIQSEENRASATVSTNLTISEPAPIVEAQGWVINNKGEVVLTAPAPTATPHIPWMTPATCHALQNSS